MISLLLSFYVALEPIACLSCTLLLYNTDQIVYVTILLYYYITDFISHNFIYL